LNICHIESSGSQLSLFSTVSLLWTHFRALVDTTWTPKQPSPTTNLVYQMSRGLVSTAPVTDTKFPLIILVEHCDLKKRYSLARAGMSIP